MNFYKYQGAGNDFIIIDNREQRFQFSAEQIASLCHRRFGIGADGLMEIVGDPAADFRMIYYNSDGRESTMCGNGGRCIILAAYDLRIISKSTRFVAIDGPHTGDILEKDVIRLGMGDVEDIQIFRGYKVLDTGSPHIIIPVNGLENYQVYEEGRAMRNDPHFGEGGINVNFIEKNGADIHIRTYERGVEQETWACGTGAVAAAISSVELSEGSYSVPVKARGGDLVVEFTVSEDLRVKDVYLTGPAAFVFEGKVNVE